MDIKKLYKNRFIENSLAKRDAMWKILCKNFFSRYIGPTDSVVDMGAGYCEFINNIHCGKKTAIDLNDDVHKFADGDVTVIRESCSAVNSIGDSTIDAVFMSNFLEHLDSKKEVYDTLKESRRILKPGGKIVILQPNIRFLHGEYWDFFDHITPLSDKSLAEALESLDMMVTVCYPRFLPYTTKSRLPRGDFIIKVYLRFPFLWRIFGKQALLVAIKS